jgi:glycosyltransferase involved in cell wall biosynthesis
MRVLFIAALPPPTHGQSLASDVLYQKLRERHEVKVVNMAKPVTRRLRDRLGRAARVLGFLRKISQGKRGADLIYLTISESRLGNLKDLCIYLICFGRLERTFIHLLGGAGMRRILERRGLQYRLNRFFISRLKGVIVEGRTQASLFAALVAPDRIHVVPNFAEDFLFVSEDEIRRKFADGSRTNVLFLSNLLSGKGHNELVEAYLSLDGELRERVRIVFVGGFDSEKSRRQFLQKLDGHPGLVYKGKFIGGMEKKALYNETHVFCLPTYYPYEGQPISILEAYATGCVVVTTAHSGIPDVFSDGVNGFAVEPKSSDSVRRVLERIHGNGQGLVDIAIRNRNTAHDRYRTEIYGTTLMNLLGLSSK